MAMHNSRTYTFNNLHTSFSTLKQRERENNERIRWEMNELENFMFDNCSVI